MCCALLLYSFGDLVLDVLMVIVQFPPRSLSAGACGARLLMLVTRVLSELLSLYRWTWECAVHVSLLLIVSMIPMTVVVIRSTVHPSVYPIFLMGLAIVHQLVMEYAVHDSIENWKVFCE